MPPRACIEEHPTSQTVILAGRPINQTILAQAANVDRGYLSRILSGKSDPGFKTARRIATALSMSIDEFLAALDQRNNSK